MAKDDLARRIAKLENGAEPPCPVTYKLWRRDFSGTFQIATDIAV